MKTCLRTYSHFVLLAALLFGAPASRANDPKLATKFGKDSTLFSMQLDPHQKITCGKTFQATIHVTTGSVWHIWSASMSSEGGLSPLHIKLPEAIQKYFEIVAIKEVGKITLGYDSSFMTETKAHFGKYDIRATIKVRDNAPAPVPFEIYVYFQTCNEVMCLPPRTFAVPMLFAGQKPVDLTIAPGKADTTHLAGEPPIETSDKSSLMKDDGGDAFGRMFALHSSTIAQPIYRKIAG